MFDLVLYYYPTCPYCRKVTRFIDKHDLEEIELKNINQNEAAETELIKVGGKRQVPCLFIDGEPLYESSDIINWLKSNLI
ncbi:Glutaredoxin [Halanaerobium congolense]|jgi:glutaredoxin|uniref:Glutaredoxin n=1 Tax=Halanaerobium congolense TaxID=54121 RepID=A0A1G7H7T2_9FIRM|nr:glutaredoxin [Halanaerobium congolense]KXS49848.1 MAG: glutaredoxin [Halanaerobium sp. T82-1]TDP13744.1 glutaredoxin [Halanaerobium congolense]TDX40313.1 glutaredoxin [Halanaerobium congolense]SDE96466.1 Glutaredoxin [Halanaerobium congolense]SDI76351.1 Glutaredoxin [Halanaerobium congolense]